MTRPPPALLQRLTRARLVPRQGRASIGVGERRSRAKGSGLEFADHRPYQPGDDARHIDLHLHARLGEAYVRQYSVFRKLPVTILVDGSASMAFGTPPKFDFARELAGVLGFTALAHGDLLQIGIVSGGGVAWSPRLAGMRRADLMFDWLARQRAGGEAGLRVALRAVMPRLAPNGFVVLLSDFWMADPPAEMKALSRGEHDLIALHVLSPEETEPARLGEGDVRLVDGETGADIDVALDGATLDRYGAALEAWRQTLRGAVTRAGGRYLPVSTDADIARIVLGDWRRAGLIVGG